MQQLTIQQENVAEHHPRSDGPRHNGLFPGHGTGSKIQASNDECYLQEESPLKMMMSVLANVVGGTIFLAAMFNLPVILAVIWGI
jgi:hypothetical protein